MAEGKLSASDVRRLYGQHGPALLAYACSFVRDLATGEDVVHQVFLRLLQGKTTMPDVPIAYLYRAVRNAALNACRNVARDVPLETHAIWLECRDADRDASLTLQRALSDLPEQQREVVVMRIWSGMTLEEVAVATGVSLHTAASRYRYGLDKLREQLRPYRQASAKEM